MSEPISSLPPGAGISGPSTRCSSLVIIALAASSAFTTPIAPPNAMVATAGGYRFADFVRVGLPFVLIVGLVSVTLVPWLFPFH